MNAHCLSFAQSECGMALRYPDGDVPTRALKALVKLAGELNESDSAISATVSAVVSSSLLAWCIFATETYSSGVWPVSFLNNLAK